jgi:hypothetical protein
MSHKLGKVVMYVVSAVVVLLIISTIWPYWNRYRMGSDLEAAALYGTKHGILDTRKFLMEKSEERGFDFDPDDITIEKDENNSVFISLTYTDEISFFGIVIKELEFTLEASAQETEEAY